MFTIPPPPPPPPPPFLCTGCFCSVVIVFSLISIVFIGCELLFLWRPTLLVVGERIKKAIILCGNKFFFLSSEYRQAVMARFCVVVAIVVCCLVTDSYGDGVDPVPGKYTRVAGMPSVWYMCTRLMIGLQYIW